MCDIEAHCLRPTPIEDNCPQYNDIQVHCIWCFCENDKIWKILKNLNFPDFDNFPDFFYFPENSRYFPENKKKLLMSPK